MPDSWKVRRLEAGEPQAALQGVDLLRADGIGDFDYDFVGHQPPLIRRRRAVRMAPRRPSWALRSRVILDINAAARPVLRDRHEHAGNCNAPSAAAIAATPISAISVAATAHADIRWSAAAEDLLRNRAIGRYQGHRHDGRHADNSVMIRAHGEVSGVASSSHSVVAMKPTTLSPCNCLTMRASSPFGNPVIDTRTL